MDTARFRRLPAAVVLTAALAGAGAAAVPAADHGAGARFRVTATFTATLVGVEPCGFRVIASGTATGTHVGNGTWSQSECVALVFDPVTGAPKVHVVGEGRITAANGDVLVVDYDALTDPPDAHGEIHPRGTFAIVGGTGRFAGSTGSGTLAVDGIANDGETAAFDGTIRP